MTRSRGTNATIGSVSDTFVSPEDIIANQSQQIERDILGGILENWHLLDDPHDTLAVDDFSIGFHQTVFREMLDFHERGDSFDEIVIAQSLERKGLLKSFNDGVYRVAELTRGALVDIKHQRHLLGQLKEQRARREAQNIGAMLLAATNDPTANAHDLLDRASVQLAHLRGGFDAHGHLVADITDTRWPHPQPINGGLPAAQSLGTALLPVSLRDLVADVGERMRVPIDFPAAIAVLGLAGSVGRRAAIQPKAKDTKFLVVPNLWGGIIGHPGMLKSPVIEAVLHPLHDIEAGWTEEYKAAVAQYERQKEEAELCLAAWRDKYKAAIKHNKTLPTRPDNTLVEPKRKRLVTHDCTQEKVHELLRVNPAGLLVSRDELAGWFEVLDKHGREGERQFFLTAWNGDSIWTSDRIGRGTTTAHCCISMLGAITPDRLKAYLNGVFGDGVTNDGLLQRFQVLVAPEMLAEVRHVDRAPDFDAVTNAQNMFSVLTALDPAEQLRFTFSDEAQSFYASWALRLEHKLRSSELHPVMASHLAKYRSLMPSLALLFELADRATKAKVLTAFKLKYADNSTVSAEHVEQAIKWCEYLESHAQRIYGSVSTPEREAAAKLANELLNGWKSNAGTFTLYELRRRCLTGLKTESTARAAVEVLCDAGWLRRVDSSKGNGRPPEAYAISPKLALLKRKK